MKEKAAKAKAAKDARPASVGDVWTWTAIDADSKLILSWFLGSCDPAPAPRHAAGRVAARILIGAHLDELHRAVESHASHAEPLHLGATAGCSAYGVPALDSLGDYVQCLARRHACATDELLRFEAPRADEWVGPWPAPAGACPAEPE
jgi:hypothetical protein